MDEKRKPGFGFWTAVALVMLLLYPLSVGPVIWAVNKFSTDPPAWVLNTFEAVYSPLRWIYDNSKTVATCLDWYISFWSP